MSRVAGHCVIDTATNAVRQLDAKTQADEIVTEEDVQEPKKLARLLTRILLLLSELRRRFAPRRVDFVDVACTGTVVAAQTIRLSHRLNARVRWYVVDWTGAVTVAPAFSRDTTNTDADVLVLSCRTTGTATIRVEDVG